MKKIISCFLAAGLAFQCIVTDAGAADTGSIVTASIGVETGETFTLPIKITENPGITALGLTLDYDSKAFELLSVEDTGLLKGAEFLAGDDVSRHPYIMNWDDISEKDHTETGVLANVNFKVRDVAMGEYSIKVGVNQSNTYNVDLGPVSFSSDGGKVTVRPAASAPVISADDVYGIPGDIVEVPVRIKNNPGIISLGLSVDYDKDDLELTGVTDCGLLGNAEFLAGKDLKKIPYILNWDDLTDKDHTDSGVLAVLRFKVLQELEYPSEVDVSLNKGSAFNAGMKDVDFFRSPGSVKTPELKDIIPIRERAPLEYSIKPSAEAKNITAETVTVSDSRIDVSSFSDYPSFNNGFNVSTDCIHEAYSEDGKLLVFYDDGETAAVYSESTAEPLLFTKAGWRYGAGTIGGDGCWYILWGKDVTDEEVFRDNDLENICISKYDSTGRLLGEAGLPNSLSNSHTPFHAGNAAIGWKDGVVLAFYDTLWTGSSDGYHHQGSCFCAADTEKMKIIEASGWQGSHSFGVSMIPTDYGFAGIQMGDAFARGIVLNLYGIYHGRVLVGGAYNVHNGSTVIYNASGQYGTNEEHLDGNTTYTHMGGIAHSRTTYAIAGKSERQYTSLVHYEDESVTNIYDVFVRLMDQDFDASEELAGVYRTDNAGNRIDPNVVWLTECDENNKAGSVKVVALDDGAYCVLWEKFNGHDFDSVRYVILDECGNILRPESVIQNARLSDNSTQPMADGYKLKWAVTDGGQNTLTFYTADLLAGEPAAVSTTTAASPTDTVTTATTAAPEPVTGSTSAAAAQTEVPATTEAAAAPAEPGTDELMKGDVNSDGFIDSSDASQILEAYANLSTGADSGLDEAHYRAADVNGDGNIDSTDASVILSYYAFISTGNTGTLDEFMAG